MMYTLPSVQKCLDNAAYCEERAAATADEDAKATFADVARSWRRHCGCSFDQAKKEIGAERQRQIKQPLIL
jgi:hypothetical protein